MAAADIVATLGDGAGLDRPPLLVLDRLERFLDANGLGAGPVHATRIGEGGGSNFSFLLERGGERYVLRRPPRPPLPPSAHDVVREARLQLALAPHGIRLPPILTVCEDTALLGVPFYVMAYLDGHVVTTGLPPGLDDPDGAPPARRGARRRAGRDPCRRRGRPGTRGLRPVGQLPRASGASLHPALGDQRDAGDPRRRRGRAPAGGGACPSRCPTPSCTATTGSAT